MANICSPVTSAAHVSLPTWSLAFVQPLALWSHAVTSKSLIFALSQTGTAFQALQTGIVLTTIPFWEVEPIDATDRRRFRNSVVFRLW